MGIGLAISRSLVQAHGGRIEAANDPSGGAVLKFTLPASFRGRELPDPRQEELAG
jgi:two-component system sensor kinase FixL